jgi:hypothetical protein
MRVPSRRDALDRDSPIQLFAYNGTSLGTHDVVVLATGGFDRGSAASAGSDVVFERCMVQRGRRPGAPALHPKRSLVFWGPNGGMRNPRPDGSAVMYFLPSPQGSYR